MGKFQKGQSGNIKGQKREPKKAMVAEAEFPRKAVPVDAGKTEEDTCRNHAVVTTSPELAAHRVIYAAERDSGMGVHIDTPTMLETLREQAKAVSDGNFKHAESMLMNQATALQSLFVRLTEKAIGAEYISNFECFMRMALRAQSQCRTTLETLAVIKNPPVVYARQANIAHGHQQVINGTAEPSRAREIENVQTQLSGRDDELLQDTRASQVEIRADQPLEALGKIDGAKVPRG